MGVGELKPFRAGSEQTAAGVCEWSAVDFVAVRKAKRRLLDPWSAVPLHDAICSEIEEVTGVEIQVHSDDGDDVSQSPNETRENELGPTVSRSEESQEAIASPVSGTDWAWHIEPGPSAARQQTVVALPGWAMNASLPGFMPDARENPFIVHLTRPTAEDIGAKRARWLVSLLDVPEPRRRRDYIRFFQNLFAMHEHHATYHALSKLALDEKIEPELLVESCRFRQHFLGRPDWWATRYGPTVSYAANGQNLMGWRRALKFVMMCGGDPGGVIDDDWFSDWLELRYGDSLRTRFVDYMEARLALYAAGVWEPIRFDRSADRSVEWKRGNGLAAASQFARTASLIGLKSLKESSRPC